MNTPTIDLATLDTVAACDAGAELELLHPVTNAPLGIFLRLLGKDSQAFREHVRKTVNARIEAETAARRRGREVAPRTVERSDAEKLEILVACSAGWRTGEAPTLTYNKEALAFSAANARKVYTALPWMREQVDAFIGDLENFLPS